MLDILYIKENIDIVKEAVIKKGVDLSINELIKLDNQRKTLITEINNYREKRNSLTKEISQIARNDSSNINLEDIKKDVRQINDQIKHQEKFLRQFEEELNYLMLKVPNIISKDTPDGLSDKDNVELERFGSIPEFSFEIKDHVSLGNDLNIFDIARGVKVAGTRNYYLKNEGLLLHQAVQQLALDFLYDKGFDILDVPLMANYETLASTGFFPTGEKQTYQIDDNKWLIGTSEVPLVGYYSNEIINVDTPIKLAGISNCFRKEAGSAGRDVHGLYRVHQFSKVEQVVICRDDKEVAESLLNEITENAKQILNLLELPYRVVAVCTGDLSDKNYKQYDIETWMPSRKSYSETHSSSNVLDFQARRSKIRYKDKDGGLRYCFTLNNTAIASPRILIPLLENHQQEDGTIYIPKSLRKYIGGKEYIGTNIKK